MFRKVSSVFLIILYVSISAYAAPAIPQDHIKYPVMVTLNNGQTGTGFFVNNEQGEAFFVTCKHLLFASNQLRSSKALLLSYPSEPELKDPIYIELNFEELVKNGYLKPDADKDVVVIQIGAIKQTLLEKNVQFVPGIKRLSNEENPQKMGSVVGAKTNIIKSFKDVLIGNDVFIFGYPTQLGIENYPQIDSLKPLLRKGIVAGKNEKNKTIIIDAPVQYGNSGGPVIEVDQSSITETKYWVIGMISEYIPSQKKNHNWKRQALFGTEVENSGYSVVIPMDTVLELINSVKPNEKS